MFGFRPLPILTVCSLLALAALCMLGFWQWERFEEKRAAAATPPVEVALGPLDEVYPEKSVFLFGVMDGRAGWRVLTPVRVGARATFVDAAFVEGVRPPEVGANSASPALARGVVLRGVRVAPSPPGPFAADPNPAARIWHVASLAAMAASVDLADVEPTFIAAPYVGGDGQARTNPFVGVTDPLPPERHLGYALTWWGMAMSLVAIYFAFHARAGRFGKAAG